MHFTGGLPCISGVFPSYEWFMTMIHHILKRFFEDLMTWARVAPSHSVDP